MNRRDLALLLALTFAPAACDARPASPAATREAPALEPGPVLLHAIDGLAIHALYYPAAHPKATILLFHQAGSSKDEYATIAPQLAAAGYSALALDQRSGGDLFGTNETVKAAGASSDYRAAMPDLEAAIAWATGRGLPLILWGSSYSSALVFPVAARHDGEIAAVLAFSPGEYIDGMSIKGAAAKVRAPLFVTSAKDVDEIAAAKAIVDASPSPLKSQFIPPTAGVHGSSTLIAARDPKGAEENMRAVMTFLAKVAP